MLETTAPPRKAPLAQPLDTRHQVETPEGIDLPLRPAGLMVRAMAFTIDLGLRGLILGVLLMVLALLGKLGIGLGSLLLFVVSWWYMVLFEVLRQGRSPGKQWMGLRVVHDDGTPVGWSASLLRNLLRFVDLMPFGYFLGAISCLQHPTFKRLGDIAAGTLVIYSERPLKRPQLPDAEHRRSPIPLNLTEQRALLAFAERQGELSTARVNELAALLAQPLHISAPKAVGELNGIARGLLGPT
ncbi:RDD family protein [Pseudomonas moraviensis]|uniref:Putative RDD family membrane protein YckC n=1 Tax=Pseudomonas moraviensis TaxID=321662 RepID=A0A7Y9VXZ7_9PSED|nr:RDD family protein [Pseudomonas moraviensis]NYH10260.1 putative RDD family membrane protein YckC [Pseudomonas moraviensis]